jgi:hypothetical protein
MGPELQHSNEKAWDPLRFEVYAGSEGVTESELTDDHRRLNFTLDVGREKLLLRGGPLDYVPEVRAHWPGEAPMRGRLGEPITR